MLTLFYTPGTCALASHIALEQAGADYRAVRISLASNEQRSAEFLRINPKGRVPVLVADQGPITETPAILAYIAQCFPDAALAPLADPFEFARIQSFNSYLCSTVHVAHAHRLRGSRWADDPAAIEAMKQKVPQSVGACFDLIEREMFQGPWVMGEQFTIADPYLYTVSRWLEGDGVDPAAFPKVHDHRVRMDDMPVVRKVLEQES